MARVVLTEHYSNLESWAGRLLEADDDTAITARRGGSFAFTHGGDHPFSGFTVTVTGRNFTYADGVAVDGTMTGVTIRNGSGQIVMSITNLGSNPLTNDLSQFYTNALGATNGDAGPDSDGKAAMSHLLAGDDTIIGSNGNDFRILVGLNAGDDVFDMKGGDNEIGGSVGNDRIVGGSGFDRITFRETHFNEGQSATGGIDANMVTGRIRDAWGFTDTFTGIEAIEGSRFNDVFTGNAERNEFAGLRGNDTLNGGDERDTASYQNDYWQGGFRGIVVDLETSFSGGQSRGQIRDGFGNRDTVISIERVIGTRYNDSFTGSRDNNIFSGGEGKDSYRGEGGFDRVEFHRFFGDEMTRGVVVDFTRASGQVRNDGFGNVENAISIEAAQGSDLNDRIIFGAGDNYMVGRDGSDTMTGGAGSDYFEWWDTEHFGDGDVITDFTATGASADKLGFEVGAFDGMTLTSGVVNGTKATSAAGVGQFVYNAANDTLFWDSNGRSAGGMMAIVELTGVARLTSTNFDLFE